MEKHIQREWIKIKGTVFNMSTTSIDWVTWMNAYQMGIRKPRYPVPAIPVEVEVFPEFIVVAEMNDPQYTFGVLTLYPHS